MCVIHGAATLQDTELGPHTQSYGAVLSRPCALRQGFSELGEFHVSGPWAKVCVWGGGLGSTGGPSTPCLPGSLFVLEGEGLPRAAIQCILGAQT